MDNISHALIGYSLYKAIEKENTIKGNEKWYRNTVILASEMPDIDSITSFMGYEYYLKWHRGISHSIILSPITAALTVAVISLFNRNLNKAYLYKLSLLSTLLHIGFDLLTAWGTGILEPFTSKKYSFGLLPIVDIIILLLIVFGIAVQRNINPKKVFAFLWIVIAVYLSLQGFQLLYIRNQVSSSYDEFVVFADFLPGRFTVVGRKGYDIEIYSRTVYSEMEKTIVRTTSHPAVERAIEIDGDAGAIAAFAPFYGAEVTLAENGYEVLIYDPRYFRKGRSFLSREVFVPY